MGRLRRIANLFHRPRLDREISEELKAHIEMRLEENLARGMTAPEAKREARLQFGNPELVRERVAGADADLWITSAWRDLRHAARQLRRSPGFAATAILTLALGIGANAAVFDVLSAVLLRPLPFPNADRVVRVISTKNAVRAGASPADVRDFSAQNHTFAYLAVYDEWRKNVVTTQPHDVPQQQIVGLAPAALFQALGVQPVTGRLFRDEEGLAGRNHVALLTEHFLKAHYPRNADVLGKAVIINSNAYEIIGVLPDTIPGWMSGRGADLWEPFLPKPTIWDESERTAKDYPTVGLLKPGVSLEQAAADLRGIAQDLGRAYPVDRGWDVRVEHLGDWRSGSMKPLLFLLTGAVALILLIACLNLAGLLMARNSAREREFAMRTALGARRGVLARQLLLEALLTSVLGAGLGMLGAWLGEFALRARYAAVPQLADVHLDWRVIAFTCAITMLTCILCGLAPAWMASRVDPSEALKEGGRTAAGSPRQSFRRAMVSLQLGLSLMLVIASGLLAQSIFRMQRQDMGFQPEHLLKAHFYLPPVQYGSAESITQFCDRFASRVRALPGVKSASITTIYPPNERWRMNFSPEGRPVSRPGDVPSSLFGVTDAQYLKTLGIPVLRGRDFAETDTESTQAVAIVNQAFVRRFFGGADPVGTHLVMGTPASLRMPDEWLGNNHVPVIIVGVMGDVRNAGLASPVEPQFIMLFRQMPLVNFGFKDVVLQTQLKPELIENELREQLQSLDATLPLSEAATMPEYLADQTWDQQLTAEVLAGFAALGTMLAVIGVYGVISFLVARRRQEIGVRMALGASRHNVIWMVVGQGARLVIAGTVLGIVGTMLAGRGVARLLYGVRALDPATIICASAGLAAAAIAAALIPAWRAAHIQPIDALRCE